MSRLSLFPFLERWREKATILYRKALKRAFNVVILLFALIFALAFTVVGYNLTRTESRESNATNSQSSTLIKVSFYDANLDFNGSIRVKADSLINIAQLKNDLDLNATVLYLADGTTSDYINNAFYQVTRNVNFYAIPNVQEIKTQTELNNAVRSNLSGKYILLNDIELTEETLGKDSEEGWNPIGYCSSLNTFCSFKGIFNGNGYVVRNLWINRPTTDNVGLFGYISNAQIKNLGVEIDNSKGGVKGEYDVGGIAGHVYVESSITNSYSTGNVSGKDYVGAIAGYVELSSSITNSYSTGNVSGDDRVGGIAGLVVAFSSITNSYSTGDVSGTSEVGGITGYVMGYSTIENNAAINQRIRGSSDVNRIVGVIDDDNGIQNNLALGAMKANGSGSFSNQADPRYHGINKSNSDLKTQSTYESGLGWKFGNDNESPWILGAFDGYPYPTLYWQTFAPSKERRN